MRNSIVNFWRNSWITSGVFSCKNSKEFPKDSSEAFQEKLLLELLRKPPEELLEKLSEKLLKEFGEELPEEILEKVPKELLEDLLKESLETFPRGISG